MNSLESLLDNFLIDRESGNERLDREKLARPQALKSMYERYTNRQEIPEIHEVIEDIPSFIKEFNKRRLWFLSNSKNFGLDDGKIVAFQDGINVVVNQGEYLNAGEIHSFDQQTDQSLKDLVYLYKPTKLNRPSDNYYVFYNGDYVLNYSERQIIRFYFSLNPDKNRILKLTGKLSENLNALKIPFTFKLPLELRNFGRSDGMVLYIAQNHFHYVKEIIIQLYYEFSQEKNSLFRDSLPLFALELKKGLGLAEDPMGVESFGMNLCKIILDIIRENVNCKTVADLGDILEEKGYKLGEFFRRPFTSYDYDISTIGTSLAFSDEKHLESYNARRDSRYNAIALDYSLDLMEKALWSSGSSFYWVTYEKREGSEYYKVISERDKDFDEIMWFLERLTRLPQNRRLFPKSALDYIEEYSLRNNFSTSTFLAKNMYKFVKEVFNEYSKVTENIFLGDMEMTFKQKFASALNEKTQWLMQYFGPPGNDPIEGDIYNIEIRYFNFPLIQELAEKIYLGYTRNQYPIKNEYGNYEYCPASQGKLQVAMIMLFVYCPELLE